MLRKSNCYQVIGLMSGTSLDGLDMAYCQFDRTEAETWRHKILETRHVAYSPTWLLKLKNGINLSPSALSALDLAYGRWIGQEVSLFTHAHNLTPDLIASHGHTIFHKPDLGITKQIGSGQEIANTTKIKTVADFRSKDVSLGGQGAPLVPIGDQKLFSEYDFCLNLGGIANVSFEKQNHRIAYDIGIANMLLNHLSNELNLEYDESGLIAQSGKANDQLLTELNNLHYYQLPFPKSTGYEWFRDEIIPLIEKSTINIPDKLATACHHISGMISRDILAHKSDDPCSLIITGGGAKNNFLIHLLQEKLKDKVNITIPDSVIIDYKEALIFAFLGVKKIRNEINCLKSVTGARQDSCGGVTYNPE